MKKIIVITGPTAVGKTGLSINLAKHFHGEIINADASQMRKELNIGTAKITEEEKDGVTHHLLDFLEPTQTFSIKEFQDLGRSLIDKINIPFIVGGSGLYIQALITDYNLDTSPRDEDVYSDYSNEELFQILKVKDEEAASKIHPNNRRRILRYLQIISERGRVATITPKEEFDSLIICLTRERSILYDRINSRCEQMFTDGWIDECRLLMDKGIDLNKIKEIGYQEINQYLDNQISYNDLVETIKQKQRRYAKRQLTWFRNKMKCEFIDIDKDDPVLIYDMINKHLESK